MDQDADVVQFMIKKVEPMLSQPEQTIIQKGDRGNRVFFIAKGHCDVFIEDHMKQIQNYKTLDQGTLFGEISIIFQIRRTVTVKSQNYSTQTFLTHKNFYEVMEFSPDTFLKIQKYSLHYDDPWTQFKIKLLSQVDYFKN